MKKKVISVVIATSLLLPSLPATQLSPTLNVHASQQQEWTGTILNSVNFRSSPSTSGTPIRYLKVNESVEILEKTNSYWYQVKDASGMVGYVTTIEKYMDVSSSPVSNIDASQIGNIVYGVSFRKGPSTSDARIRYLQKGESVEILEETNSYWYQVKDQNGIIGYTSTSDKYIQTDYQTPSEPEPEPTPGDIDVTQVGNIVYGVSFRRGPSTSDARIRYLQKGETVEILEKTNSYWYQVKDQNGVIGYTSTSDKYIQTDYQPIPTPSPDPEPPAEDIEASSIGRILYGVSFRTGPSTSDVRIRYLQKDEIVEILQQENQYWYKVKDQNGVIGYTSTNNKYIDTDYKITDNSDYGDQDSSVLAQQVIDAGFKYLGTPYEYGSSRNNTATFDCSDFVRQAFIDGIGLSLPSDSRSQGDYVQDLGNTITDWAKLEPGDIMFFMSYEGTSSSDYSGINKSVATITHNGIYLGDGKVLHTYSNNAGGVRVNSIIDNHWEYRFLFGGSPIQ